MKMPAQAVQFIFLQKRPLAETAFIVSQEAKWSCHGFSKIIEFSK